MTSIDGLKNTTFVEDAGNYTDYTDYTSDDDDYDDLAFHNQRQTTYLVFHGLEKGLHNMDDKQLVEWVLTYGLGLEPSKYVTSIERFGINYRPIRANIHTVEKHRKIWSLAKNLERQTGFSGIEIQPWLSRKGQELYWKLKSLRRDGYESVRIIGDNILQNGSRVLYRADP